MHFIAMLRGINVSGRKKILMADLKVLFVDIGLDKVETYIQSGNVVFDSSSDDADKLQTAIEAAIEQRFGFSVHVAIRSRSDLKRIIERYPFDGIETAGNEKRIMVSFLSNQPANEKEAKLMQYVKEPELLLMSGREAYLYCPGGYGKSKLSNTFLEKVLDLQATTRNWRTIEKLYQMSEHHT